MMKVIGAAAATLLLSACTTTGNVERNTATGAALGAVAGAVIGNNVGDGDAERGAAIGAVLGGAAGAVRGVQQDTAQGEGTRMRQPAEGQQLYWDRSRGRYYYCTADGKSYWRNGELRGQGC